MAAIPAVCPAFLANGRRCAVPQAIYHLHIGAVCRRHCDVYNRILDKAENDVQKAMNNWNVMQEKHRRKGGHVVPRPANGPGFDDNDFVANIVQDMIVRGVDIPKPVREMENFVKDKQNVHTTAAVKQTQGIIDRILKIEVPKDYKWNTKTCSKTPGEIISECSLSINASRVMMDKYTLADDIYEFGPGIYGRVLDCVWQYIKKSSDKADLCKIMKTELEDNIGMCLQGNLTRLCNVLAGYLEGVDSGESVAEVLGREFAKLWDIDDEDERVEAGNSILDRMAVVDKKVREDWIASLY
jgi:hypothetical protein